jgi:hypothetical protein
LVYRIRLPANNSTDTATIYIQINPVSASGVFSWGYPFPRADAVDPTKVRLWAFGQAKPSPYNIGDILVVTGPSGTVTTPENDPPFDLLGPVVLCGIDFRPSPNRIGSPFNANNPYRGTNRIIMFHFAANAKAHATWEHETGKAVDWPFIFFCNSRINYQTNGCQFGDLMRGGIKGVSRKTPLLMRWLALSAPCFGTRFTLSAVHTMQMTNIAPADSFCGRMRCTQTAGSSQILVASAVPCAGGSPTFT